LSFMNTEFFFSMQRFNKVHFIALFFFGIFTLLCVCVFHSFVSFCPYFEFVWSFVVQLMQWAETLDAMPYEVQATIWSYCPHTPHLATFKTTLQHWALDPIPNMNHSNALYNAVLFVYHQLLQVPHSLYFKYSNWAHFSFINSVFSSSSFL
jgi:hypothetical protein